MDVEYDILGGEALDKALEELPAMVEKRVVLKGLRAGAKVITKDMKSRVASKDGLLKKEIRTKAGKKDRGSIIIQIFTSAKAWYAHFIEFGVKTHALGKKSNLSQGKQSGKKHPGFKEKPFFRPAVDENHAEVLKVMGEKIGDEIVKEVAK